MVNSGDFAKRLQMILNHYGISATTFSAEINFNRSTISHLLSGRNKPSLEFILKVLQKYPEVELHWLIEGKGFFPLEKNIPPIAPFESKKETPNLFEQILPATEPKKIAQHEIENNLTEIEQIVIFYKNGKFKVYQS